MSLVQRILFAIRTILEDDPPPRRKKHGTNCNSSRQAVALVLTFKELFTSGNLNIILEDIETNKLSKNKRKYYRSSSNTRIFVGSPTATSSPIVPRASTTESNAVNSNRELVPLLPTVWPVVLADIEATVPLLHEERILSCPRVDFQNMNSLIKQKLESTANREIVPYSKTKKPSANTNLTVTLSPDNEKESVAALRKVMKWSPRKQNAVSFAVPLPKKEEHKAVAVVQNAVNRVKEENSHKKKRKWKLKFTFC